MDIETKNLLKELAEIFDSIVWSVSVPPPPEERIKLAVQLQRNKILKEELSAIYSILDDIRYNRVT